MASRTVVRDFERAIAAAGASPREALALQLAGGPESGWQELVGGDRDSTGALQQRPSQGWGPVGEGAYTDALQFLSRAKAVNRKGFKGSAGELAQAVQRSGTPGVYDAPANRAAAARLFRSSGSAASRSRARASSGLSMDLSVAPALAEILAQATPRAAGQQTLGMPLPGFAAKAVLPTGYQAPAAPAAAQAAQTPDLGQLAAQVVATVQPDAPAAAQEGAQDGAQAAPAAAGKVTLAPGANKPGTSLTRGLEKILGQLGDVTVGTGTNHSYLTVNGRVSDHVSGNAADLPATGKALTAELGKALATYGVGKTVTWERNDGKTVQVKVTADNVGQLAAQGGLFNIGYGKTRRIQVIGNSHIGGDHTNHIHVGLSPNA